MVLKEGYNPVEAEKAYDRNKELLKEEFGDLNKYLRRIAKKIKNNGMDYEAINNNTITFKGHTVKLVTEEGIVSFDGEEMKWTQTAPLIIEAKNQ